MKKKLIIVLGLFLLITANVTVQAKITSNDDLASAIKLYKQGNYTECYEKLSRIIKKESPNALSYYYMAITSVQTGRKNEALSYYEKAIALTSPSSNIAVYANKGIECIKSPDKCTASNENVSDVEDFIRNFKSGSISKEVQEEIERLKIENIMREMNRNNDISPEQFRDYKDFSSMNNDGAPSNDEVVAALKTLQKAGFGNLLNSHNNDISLMTDSSGNPSSILNMMGQGNINPQVLQTLFTNNMSLGF